MMGGFGVDWQQLWLMIAPAGALLGLSAVATPEFTGAGRSLRSSAWLPLAVAQLLVVATGWMVGVSVALAGRLALSVCDPAYSAACG